METISHKNVLDKIKYYSPKGFKASEVDFILKNRDLVEHQLLSVLHDALSNTLDFLEEEREDLILASYILAYWKVEAAFDLFLKIFSLPEDVLDTLFGDIVTEDLPIFLYRTAHGRIDDLKEFIQRDDVDDFVRGSALGTLSFMCLNSSEHKKIIMPFYEGILRKAIFHDFDEAGGEFDYIPTFVVSELYSLYPGNYLNQIKSVFKVGAIEEDFIELRDIQKAVNKGEKVCLEEFKQEFLSRDITDIRESMSWMDGYKTASKFH
jgi:hypothetical protein